MKFWGYEILGAAMKKRRRRGLPGLTDAQATAQSTE
jgi:hypothetical protein